MFEYTVRTFGEPVYEKKQTQIRTGKERKKIQRKLGK